MTYGVIVLVVLGQIAIFVRCWVLATTGGFYDLDRLRNAFERDIRNRAKRGDGPDWLYYMDEADRIHERRGNRMRVWATSALVVGIGGAMSVLVFRLWGLSTFEPEVLAAALGLALLASLSGVLNNLAITIFLFRFSDDLFEQALGGFRKALRACAEKHAPREWFDQLGAAFREAVCSFPETVEQLDRSVLRMGESAATQSHSITLAASGLQQGVDGIRASGERIASIAEQLGDATTGLRTVPGELRQNLEKTRETWAHEMRSDQEAFLGSVGQVLESLQRWERGRNGAAARQEEQWRESVKLVQNASDRIVATTEGLPNAFARGVEKIAGRLGREFGFSAQNSIGDLREEMQKGSRTLGKRIKDSTQELQNCLLNETSRVVGESAEEFHGRVGEPLVSMFQDVSRGIEEALRTLPENAMTFATSLTIADEKLQQSISRLQESADHLERVAQLHEDFGTSLTRAFRDEAAECLDPIRKDLQAIACKLPPAEARAAAQGRHPYQNIFRRLFGRQRPRRYSYQNVFRRLFGRWRLKTAAGSLRNRDLGDNEG